MIRKSLLITLSFLILSCAEDDSSNLNQFHTVTTLEAEVLNEGGVILKGSFTKSEGVVTDHGFKLMRENEGYALKAISLGKPEKAGNFSVEISSDLESGRTYYYQAYIDVDQERIYGDTQSFTSSGSKQPVISSVLPLKAHIDDTISIIGNYFGERSHANIRFGQVRGQVITSSDTLVKCIVPEAIEHAQVSLTMSLDEFSVNLGSFELEQPVITSFSPKSAGFRGILEIHGDHFDTKIERNRVKIGNAEAIVSASSRRKLVIVVPDEVESSFSKIAVIAQNQETLSTDDFELIGPEITEVASSGHSRDELIVRGANFHPNYYQNKVLFGEAEAEIVKGTTNELTVRVPDGPYPNREMEVFVSVLDKTANSISTFSIEDNWRMISSTIPISYYGSPGTFVIDNKAYLVCRSADFTDPNTYLWTYDPQNRTWSNQEILFDFNFYGDVVGNGQNGYMYTSTETDNFWEYSATSDSWTKKTDFPGPRRGYATTFTINGKIYLGMGVEVDVYSGDDYTDYYVYDPSLDQWAQISDIPLDIWGGKERRNASTFTIGNHVYLVGGASNTGDKDYWRYDPSLDQWTELGDFQYAIHSTSSFELNGKGYLANGDPIGGSGRNFCWEYDAALNTWTEVDPIGNKGRERGFAFVIDGIPYVGGGSGSSYSNVEKEMYIWEPN